MKGEFANRQSMHLNVLNLLDSPVHKPVWENQSPVIFTAKSLVLRQKVNALTTTIAKQEADITGRAEQKDREETELETIAHELGQSLADFLEDRDREAEAAGTRPHTKPQSRLRN